MGTFANDSGVYTPPIPEVPDTSRISVLTEMRARQKKDLEYISRVFTKTANIEKSHQMKLRRLTSGPGYEAFRKYRDALQTKLMDKVFPGDGYVSDKEMANLRAERNQKAHKYLASKKIDINKLRQLNQASRQSMARLIKPPIDMLKKKPVVILKPEQVPLSIRSGKTNPWTIKTPPFDGWSWSYNGYVAGFDFTPTLYLDHLAGFMGNSNYLRDSSAGDFDYGYITYDSQISIWYKMPSAGILEVYVEALPTVNQHYCSLYDEWGWSDSSVYQRNYITLQVNGGSMKTSQASYWYEYGYTNGHWNNSYLQNASPYWYHIYSAEAYAKDQWVLPRIGSRTWNSCIANDVSTYSQLDFRWFINRVFIRVV